MKEMMQSKLSQLMYELNAFAETYKAELASVPVHRRTSATEDVDRAIAALDDAMHEINHAQEAEQEEDHANSSRANSKDYQAEERATTDRGND